MLPLNKTFNLDNVKSAIDSNVILYSSNICAAPIQVRDLQVRVQQVNEFEQRNIEDLNKFSSIYQQRQLKDGVVFKNMMMRDDLLEFEDSSDEEGRIPSPSKTSEDSGNHLAASGPSESIEAEAELKPS